MTDTMSKGPHSNRITHEHTLPETIQNNNEKWQEEINMNKAPDGSYSENRESVIRTRYGRFVKKNGQANLLEEHYIVKHRHHTWQSQLVQNPRVDHFTTFYQLNKHCFWSTLQLACYWSTSRTACNHKS